MSEEKKLKPTSTSNFTTTQQNTYKYPQHEQIHICIENDFQQLFFAYSPFHSHQLVRLSKEKQSIKKTKFVQNIKKNSNKGWGGGEGLYWSIGMICIAYNITFHFRRLNFGMQVQLKQLEMQKREILDSIDSAIEWLESIGIRHLLTCLNSSHVVRRRHSRKDVQATTTKKCSIITLFCFSFRFFRRKAKQYMLQTIVEGIFGLKISTKPPQTKMLISKFNVCANELNDAICTSVLAFFPVVLKPNVNVEALSFTITHVFAHLLPCSRDTKLRMYA